MPHLTFVFWQNLLSIHQSALLRSLAEYPDIEVYLGYEEDLPEHRVEMGWSVPDFGKAQLVNLQNIDDCQRLMGYNDDSVVHFFSGFFSFPIVWNAFKQLHQSGTTIGIMSEAFNFLHFAGWLRLQRARCHTLRWKDAFDIVLPMGKLGTSFFRSAGFPEAKLFEFAYFVEKTTVVFSDNILQSKPEPFSILYVGQLIPRKGMDILLEALAMCHEKNWQLTIVGDGPQRAELYEIATKLQIAHKVIFQGNRPNSEAVKEMYKADLLVLPSRWDGWGAVVNEALMVGTPVICSDKCGASTLLQSDVQGDVFRSGDVDDLANKLRIHLNRGNHLLDSRAHLQQWARCIYGQQGAEYLLAIVQATREKSIKPTAPWQA